MNRTELPAYIYKRIEADATKWAETARSTGYQEGIGDYIDGATAEALRAQVLINTLVKIVSYELRGHEIEVAKAALKQYIEFNKES
jgi:hypothetical protein